MNQYFAGNGGGIDWIGNFFNSVFGSFSILYGVWKRRKMFKIFKYINQVFMKGVDGCPQIDNKTWFWSKWETILQKEFHFYSMRSKVHFSNAIHTVRPWIPLLHQSTFMLPVSNAKVLLWLSRVLHNNSDNILVTMREN